MPTSRNTRPAVGSRTPSWSAVRSRGCGTSRVIRPRVVSRPGMGVTDGAVPPAWAVGPPPSPWRAVVAVAFVLGSGAGGAGRAEPARRARPPPTGRRRRRSRRRLAGRPGRRRRSRCRCSDPTTGGRPSTPGSPWPRPGWRRSRPPRCGTPSVANRETVVAPGARGAASRQPRARLAKVILLGPRPGRGPPGRRRGPGPGPGGPARGHPPGAGPTSGCTASETPTYDGAYRQGLVAASPSARPGVDPGPQRDRLADRASSAPTARGCRTGPTLGALSPAPASSARRPTPRRRRVVRACVRSRRHRAGDRRPDWLDAVQNADGGWGFFPGDAHRPQLDRRGPAGRHRRRRRARSGSPAHCGRCSSFQLGCASPVADRGAFTFPGTGGAAEPVATVQAVPAGWRWPPRSSAPAGTGRWWTARPAGTSTTTTSTTTTSTTHHHDDHGGRRRRPRGPHDGTAVSATGRRRPSSQLRGRAVDSRLTGEPRR